MITGAQCREARALLKWSRDRLAAKGGLTTSALKDFEIGKRIPASTIGLQLTEALEAAGIEFIVENNGGPGVRLRKEKVHKRRSD